MEKLLADIKEKLLNNVYKNEEHIRLSLVCRLLLKLGWDIWNPTEVNTEFPPTRSEDNTKVDIALFAQGSIPSIFIETKALGKLVSNLSNIERQVRDYNRNNTAPFSVITDGRIWRFYFSQTAGEFHEKCFKECDLINDDLDSIGELLELFIGKDNILSGRAESEALQYLQFTQLEKAVQDLSSQARQMTYVHPYPRLPEALAELLSRKRFDVSETQAAELLRRMDTPQPSTITFSPSKNHIENELPLKKNFAKSFDKTKDLSPRKNGKRKPAQKIRKFSFEGNLYPINTARGCLRKLCEILRDKDPRNLEKLLVLNDFSTNKRELHKSKGVEQIQGTNIYMNTNFDFKTTVELCYDIIQTLGLPRDVLEIE
jgi:hypothetical protein